MVLPCLALDCFDVCLNVSINGNHAETPECSIFLQHRVSPLLDDAACRNQLLVQTETVARNNGQASMRQNFRDMQEEREELVKQIFPQLRRLCESRGVTWGEVDLRWGVPDEAKAEGKVLPLCLAEIERCRPYFICR
jgi:hypothetical protein